MSTVPSLISVLLCWQCFSGCSTSCRAGHDNSILREIQDAGFTVVRERRCRLRLGDATLMFQHLQGRPDYSRVVDFMSSSPLVALELKRAHAVQTWLAMCGPSDPQKARAKAPRTVRARYGTGALAGTQRVSARKQGTLAQALLAVVETANPTAKLGGMS